VDDGGPPGQTRLGNLGPFARPGHRAVTHGGWAKHQPEPGYYVFRSPTDMSTSSPTKAPSPSATPPSALPSGKPPHLSQRPPSEAQIRGPL
jgi:hypothetical protein